jgi:type I restriction enzyme S subunit
MKFESFRNARVVRSSWLEEGGRRLDCNPYMSGALEARDALKLLKAPKDELRDVTTSIFHAGREARLWVDSPEYGVPFLGSSDILSADLSRLPLMSKKQVKRNPLFTIGNKWTLITRSGTIGRMAYVRPDMAGLACSEHVLRVVPDEARILPGYLYAFLTSKYGVPLVTSGTYGAIIQHIESEHIAGLPVPRFGSDFEETVHDLIQFCADSRSRAQTTLLSALMAFEHAAGLTKGRVGTVTDFSTSAVTCSALLDRLDAPYHCKSALLAERMLDNSQFPVENLPDIVEKYFKPPIFKRLWVDSAEHGRLFVSGNDIYRYHQEEARYVSRRTPRFDDFILKKGWVVFQAAGQIYGLFGRPLFVSGWLENAFCADDVFRIVPHNEVDGAFLHLFFSTQAGQVLIKRQASGNSIPRLWEPHVSRLRVLWPSPEVRAKYAVSVIEAHESIERARQAETKAVCLVEQRIAGIT